MEQTDPFGFFKSCTKFEKIVFILAQCAACILPFMLLAMQWKIALALWVTTFILLIVLGISKKLTTGEKLSISIIPKLHWFGSKKR